MTPKQDKLTVDSISCFQEDTNQWKLRTNGKSHG